METEDEKARTRKRPRPRNIFSRSLKKSKKFEKN